MRTKLSSFINIRPDTARLIAAIAVALTPFAASAQSPTAYTCNVGSEIRLASISYGTQPDGAGCEVIYEKRTDGIPPKAIWRAKHDLGFCAAKLLATVGKLTAGGWQCSPDTETTAPTTMSTPDADRVLPLKSAAVSPDLKASKIPAIAPLKLKTNVAPNLSSPRAPANSFPLKQQPVAKAPAAKSKPAFDDWIFRWDSEQKKLVFTLYNSREPSEVRSFSWAHSRLSKSAASPSNIVLALDENDNQILIIAWPGAQAQHITVLDPLFQERPVCEIKTESTSDSGWNYVVENKKLYLTGMKSRNGNRTDLVEFKKPCTYVR